MIRATTRSTRTDTLFPYTTLIRSYAWAAVKCGVPREVIEIINAALAKAMPVKPRVWKRLDSYSALMVDYHNAIAAVFWNLGPECCWIVFNEPRPAGTCLRGLLATETKASGSVYAKSHKSPDWDTAAEEEIGRAHV